MSQELSAKVVVVVGGAGFLGSKFSKALKKAGATVIVADIAKGADVLIDVTDQASVDAAFEAVATEHGRIDAVVNSAAIDPKLDDGHDLSHTFEAYPEELMHQSIDVNLLGTWRVCKAAVKQLRRQQGGTIVNVASFYGVTPPRQEIYPEGVEKPVDYPITKAAVIMLTRHLAAQFGRDNIRCNALAPGGVERNHDDDFKKTYSQHTSLGRMNTPDEVADALVFLVSDVSRGITGETLVVDTGWSSR